MDGRYMCTPYVLRQVSEESQNIPEGFLTLTLYSPYRLLLTDPDSPQEVSGI